MHARTSNLSEILNQIDDWIAMETKAITVSCFALDSTSHPWFNGNVSYHGIFLQVNITYD